MVDAIPARVGRMRRALVVALIWVALPVGGPESVTAAAQEPLPLLEATVDPEHFALAGSDVIARGRVSVVYAPDGPELVVHRVHADAVQPRITYPEPPLLPEPLDVGEVTPGERALWVWQTRRILDDPVERARFLDFVGEQALTRIFLLIPPGSGATHSAGFIPFSSEEVGPLVAEIRARGALTYALDGDPSYALPENHAGVERTVRRVVEHNRSVPGEERFHGIRYDIEPYLVPGFQGARRQALLDGYVSVLDRASRTARAGGLRFAVDIPFWLDAPDEETATFLEATLDGRSVPVLEHVMASADDIAIMDYRTAALGPNGALVHAFNEIEMAARFGVDIFVGLETVRLNDEDLHTFFGPPTDGLPPHGRTRWIVLETGVAGAARIWLVDSNEALAEVERRTSGTTAVRYWPAGRPTRVAGDAQSFRSLGADRLWAVAEEIERYLAGQPAFAGLALHDYVGYRELLGGG